MALCDYLIAADITGYDCAHPMVEGAESMGLLINKADIDSLVLGGFQVVNLTLKCGGKKAYKVRQLGKTPFEGTQQEMAEGKFANTLTNTVQFVILQHDSITAEDVFALANGEFVAIIPDKMGNYQVYGAENGLRATGAVRELYNDDVKSGWTITMVEENTVMGNLFLSSPTIFDNLQTTTAECE